MHADLTIPPLGILIDDAARQLRLRLQQNPNVLDWLEIDSYTNDTWKRSPFQKLIELERTSTPRDFVRGQDSYTFVHPCPPEEPVEMLFQNCEAQGTCLATLSQRSTACTCTFSTVH